MSARCTCCCSPGSCPSSELMAVSSSGSAGLPEARQRLLSVPRTRVHHD